LATKKQYLAKADIWQRPIFGKSHKLAKLNIWQNSIFGNVNIGQKPTGHPMRPKAACFYSFLATIRSI
jgi:hypothetical protein